MKLIAGSEYLSLDILSINNEDSANEKWLSTYLKIKLDNLDVWKDISFYGDELIDFIQSLSKLKDSAVKKILFSNIEGDINFSIFLNSKGCVLIDGILAFEKSELKFELITDISALDSFIKQALFEISKYQSIRQ
jgi:hypothetical protein